MEKEEKKISLENCDFKKKKVRINSPFSLSAFELLGIDENDLIFISKDEYLRKNQDCQNLKKELQEERYYHFNLKRLKLIELAKKKREELIQENKEQIKKCTENENFENTEHNTNIKNDAYKTFYTKRDKLKKSSSVGMMRMTGGFKGVWGTSTAIKEERERLRKLKERQEINIRLQIDYECAMEENRRKNIEKMKLKEEKEEIKRKEKKKLLMEKLRKDEEKEKNRKKKEEEYNHKIEEKRKNDEIKEKLKQEEEQKKKEEEEIERKRQIKLQEKKDKEFREKVDSINKQKHFRLLEKQKILDQKDKRRKFNMEKLKEINTKKMNEMHKMMEEKITKALVKNESLMKEKINN